MLLAYLDMSRNQVINPLSLFYFFAQDFRSDLAFKKQDTRLTAALDTRRLWGALSYRACFVVYFSFFSVVLFFFVVRVLSGCSSQSVAYTNRPSRDTNKWYTFELLFPHTNETGSQVRPLTVEITAAGRSSLKRLNQTGLPL